MHACQIIWMINFDKNKFLANFDTILCTSYIPYEKSLLIIKMV